MEGSDETAAIDDELICADDSADDFVEFVEIVGRLRFAVILRSESTTFGYPSTRSRQQARQIRQRRSSPRHGQTNVEKNRSELLLPSSLDALLKCLWQLPQLRWATAVGQLDALT